MTVWEIEPMLPQIKWGHDIRSEQKKVNCPQLPIFLDIQVKKRVQKSYLSLAFLVIFKSHDFQKILSNWINVRRWLEGCNLTAACLHTTSRYIRIFVCFVLGIFVCGGFQLRGRLWSILIRGVSKTMGLSRSLRYELSSIEGSDIGDVFSWVSEWMAINVMFSILGRYTWRGSYNIYRNQSSIRLGP